LFARILHDIWESESDIPLITAGDLNWTSDRIQSDLLQRLNRDNFKPAVDADIVHHAGKLDEEFSTDVHRRVASALLLESLPLSDSSAMDKSELTLAVLRPTDVGHEPSEAIDRLMSVCWHTYKDNSGQRFQFRYEPNVNKLIEERAGQILREDAKSHVMTTAQNHYKGHTFKLIAYPGSPQSVRDSAELKLVLCDIEGMAQAICNFEDNSNPDAIRPRAFRNAILGLAPTSSLFNDAIEDVRRLMAAEDISKEQKRGPVKEQVDNLIGTMRKNANIAALRSFNRVILHGRPSMTLTEKYLVSEEGPMAGVSGQSRLKTFLDDNKLIYQQSDVIDVDLLLDMINGATPSLVYQGAYPASAVYERALASNRLKLMLNENPVRESILKAVKQGKLVIRMPNGDVYDKDGCVTGPEGARTKDPNRELRTLKLESDVFLATPSAICVQNWLKVDEAPSPDKVLGLKEAADVKDTTQQKVEDASNIGQIDYVFKDGEKKIVVNEKFEGWTPTIPKEAEANTWEGAINYARNRPLMKLELRSTSPDSAGKLIEYAQPFSAKSLNQSVLMSGTTKDGGSLNFKVDNVKHNSTLNPIKISRDLVRALGAMSKYEAKLSLDFGDDGAIDTSSKFEDAQNKADDNIGINAKFGAEIDREEKN